MCNIANCDKAIELLFLTFAIFVTEKSILNNCSGSDHIPPKNWLHQIKFYFSKEYRKYILEIDFCMKQSGPF